MKQTLALDGIVERLPQLLGDGNPPAQPWSIQDSMLENFRRVCKSLLGNSTVGRVMAGLSVTIDSANVTVSAGYGISRGGDLIVLSKPWSNSHNISGISTKYVYLEYSTLDRLDAMGGHSSYVNRDATVKAIIRDSAGADDTDTASTTGITHPITVSDTVNQTDTRMYLGMIVATQPVSTLVFNFIPATTGNEYVEYASTHQFKSRLFTGVGTVYTQLSTDSRMVLPAGRKMLRKINILRLSPSTGGSIRTDPSSLLRLSVSVFGNGRGSLPGYTFPTPLEDLAGSYVSKTYEPNFILDDGAVTIQLDVACTSPAFTTDPGVDAGGTGSCQIEFVVEKLN